MEPVFTRDGIPLHLRQWRLRRGARGTVVIVHGLGEHIGRYHALAEALNAEGWQVAGHDHRGHGASGGARGRIARADALLEDLAVVVDAVRPSSAGPLVLMGHSMGGLVAARFVAELVGPRPAGWSRPVDGLVLSSPALDPGLTALQKLMLAVLGPLAPHLALPNGLPPEGLSRDPAVVRAYQADPLVHDRITPLLTRFIVDGGVAVRSRAAQWPLPTLLMWGGADRCVDPSGSEAFARAAPPARLTAVPWPELRHEIFNEPEHAAVRACMAQWLRQQFSDMPSRMAGTL